VLAETDTSEVALGIEIKGKLSPCGKLIYQQNYINGTNSAIIVDSISLYGINA